MNFLRHSAANAAYEGARAGIVPGATPTDAHNAALNLLEAVHAAQGVNITVTPQMDRVGVSVTIPVNQNGWGIGRFTSGLNVVQACTLSRESFQ
jgi:hypothetical protein